MALTADVVIIGGGVTGTSIAFHLATRGVRDVILVDKSVIAVASAPGGAMSENGGLRQGPAATAGLRAFTAIPTHSRGRRPPPQPNQPGR